MSLLNHLNLVCFDFLYAHMQIPELFCGESTQPTTANPFSLPENYVAAQNKTVSPVPENLSGVLMMLS